MYAKLFTSIYQGTLRGNSHGLLVFTNLLAHADASGEVDIHPRAIAEEIGLTQDEVRAALLVLEEPDEESRSPEEEGRRIIRMDAHRSWGWRIVNYVKYRSIRNEDDRREQNRLAQQRFREKQKSSDRNQSKPRKPESAQAEAEAYIKEANASLSATSQQTDEQPTDLLGDAPTNGAKVPPCPMDRLINAYEAEMPMLAQVRRSLFKESKRAAAMRQRWAWVMTAKHERGERAGMKLANTVEDGVEWFRKFFEYAAQSDFLTGRNGKWNGCNIGFLMSKEKFEKVLEGGYMNNEATHG